MTSKRSKLVLAFLTVSLTGSLLAQDAAEKKEAPKAAAPAMAAQAPKPDAEMSQLKFFLGTWSCKGMSPSTSLGPEHPSVATVRATSELGGFWVNARYEEQKTAENPMPYRISVMWGHDAKDKKFDAWGFDNFGGYGRQETTGWDGDKLVWSGSSMLMGKDTKSRDTFTKKGDSKLTHVGEYELDGKWTKVDEETCTKAAAKKAAAAEKK